MYFLGSMVITVFGNRDSDLDVRIRIKGRRVLLFVRKGAIRPVALGSPPNGLGGDSYRRMPTSSFKWKSCSIR